MAALRGGGPADLVEVTVALARRMLTLAGLAGGPDPADVLAAGRAHDVWQRMVTAQGGDPDAPLPVAPHVETLPAPATGFLRRLDARAVGLVAWRLGAGRARQDDEVSAVAGVRWFAGLGERVVAGAPLLELHTDDPARLATARAALADAVEIADTPPSVQRLVLDHVHL